MVDALGVNEGRLFTGGGSSRGRSKGGGGVAKKALPVVAVVAGLIVALIVLVPMGISVLLGTIKNNLLCAIGICNTVAVLEQQTEHVMVGMAQAGKVPQGLYEDLLAQGIEVGQVTLAGDFVRTNVYLADIGGEVAAEGGYQSNGSGELALRFKGEVIPAGDFVAKVESDPVLYAAFSEAVDISARYYYSDTVNGVYNKMGLDRNMFASWQATGDEKKDQESFDEIFVKALDTNMNVNTASQYNDLIKKPCADGETCQCEVVWGPKSWDEDTGDNEYQAYGFVSEVASNSRGSNNGTSANQNSAELLNATVSSGEVYLATNAFLAVVEAIEQAQAGDNGPVNYVMNALSTPKQVTYFDIKKGMLVTSSKSILESTNFMATISDAEYSKDEASNFNRDRVLEGAGLAYEENTDKAIKSTVVSSDGGKLSNLGIVMKNDSTSNSTECLECKKKNLCGGGGESDCSSVCGGGADIDSSLAVVESVSLGLMEKNSDVFQSEVGANRIVEGGSFLSNSINRYALGAMPSDESTVLSYQKEVNEIIARQKAAERATKSPFDISSPNTFMGSLMRKIAMASLPSYGKGGSVISSIGSSVLGLTRSAFSGLVSSTMADGTEEEFTTMMGECTTVGTTGASCDLYGTAHTTVSTDYMDYNSYEDFKSNRYLSNAIDSEGNILDKRSGLTEFIGLGMGRMTTVGVRNYEVCKKWKETNYNFLQKFWDSLVNGAGKLESECNGVDDAIATSAKYNFTDENGYNEEMRAYAAFVRYDTVYSLLEGKQSRVTAYREKYLERELDDGVLSSEYAGVE